MSPKFKENMSDVYLWETYDRLGREAVDRRDLPQAAEAFRSAVATAEELGSNDRLALSLRNLAATMVEQGALGDAFELLSRTLDLSAESLGAHHSQTVETQRDLARVCRDLGYLDKAEGYLKTVLAEDSQAGSDEAIVSTLDALARLSQDKNSPSDAATYYGQIVEIKTRELGDEHPEVAQYLLKMSTSLYQSEQGDKAQAPMNVALGILESQFADEPLHLAQSLMASAQLMVEASQLEPALQHQKRALDLMTEHLPEDDERLWTARELIATSLAGLGKLEEAIELLEYCLRNRPDMPEHQLGAIHKNLGGLYLTLGKNERAEELYAKASELLENSLGPEHPAVLATREERIQLYHFTGRSKEALELALASIRATENRFGPGHPNTAQTYASTALLAFNAEDWKTALELMRGAEKVWQSLSPKPEDVLANCRTNIASCLINLGEFDEAGTILDLAEETAGASLRPVIKNLRQELQSSKEKSEVASVDENKPTESKQEPDDEFSLPDLDEFLADPTQDDSKPIDPEAETTDFGTPDLDSLELPDLPDVTPPVDNVIESEAPTDDLGAPPLGATSDQDEPESAEGADVEAEALEVAAAETEVETEAQESEEEPEALEVAEAETEVETEVQESEEEPEALEVAEAETEVEAEVQESEEEPEALEVAEAETEVETEEAESEEEPEAVEAAQAEQPVPSAEEFTERRANPRKPLSLNRFFELKVVRPDSTDDLKSFLVDLGMGGIRINSESPFPNDGPLVVSLPPDLLGEAADLKAEVVWQKPLYGSSYLQGLAFRDLTISQTELLKKRVDDDESNPGRAKGRQHFRLYRPFPIKVQAASGENWVSSYATDLSINGLGTRLRETLGQDNGVKLRLELEFELPTVEVEARVAWSREGDNGVTHGLQFSDVGPVEAKTIKRYIDRCLAFLPD